jgi:glucokinase
LCGNDIGGIAAETVSEACRHGDALALALLNDAGRALGVGIAGMINAFNPARVILGGGVLEGMPEMLSIAEREARKRALRAPLRDVAIVKAALGATAGAIGAAARARDLICGGHTA